LGFGIWDVAFAIWDYFGFWIASILDFGFWISDFAIFQELRERVIDSMLDRDAYY